ncbi:ATP-binding cassette domain-containing protein [Nonomuraea rubra]|uniref:ATP-binding cassette domain-containing protein n=1 Tax=Nonomuraea rubra TaxID=46180 RepID=UPI00361F5BC1
MSFTYPGTGRQVLHDLDLHLPAGATIALVGAHGSGKTTLAKLLCGLYHPDRGEIRADDVPLHALAPGSGGSASAPSSRTWHASS